MPTPEYKLYIPSPEGDKFVHVKTPDDQAWIEHQKARPMFQKDMGRGESSQSIPENYEADLKLYQSIRLEGSADLDKYEAAIVRQHLEQFSITGLEVEGREYVVTALAAGDHEVSFRLRKPSARDLLLYRESRASLRTLQHGVIRINMHLAPAVDLFDSCATEETGTEHSAIWKARVCSAISDHIGQLGGGQNFR